MLFQYWTNMFCGNGCCDFAATCYKSNAGVNFCCSSGQNACSDSGNYCCQGTLSVCCSGKCCPGNTHRCSNGQCVALSSGSSGSSSGPSSGSSSGSSGSTTLTCDSSVGLNEACPGYCCQQGSKCSNRVCCGPTEIGCISGFARAYCCKEGFKCFDDGGGCIPNNMSSTDVSEKTILYSSQMWSETGYVKSLGETAIIPPVGPYYVKDGVSYSCNKFYGNTPTGCCNGPVSSTGTCDNITNSTTLACPSGSYPDKVYKVCITNGYKFCDVRSSINGQVINSCKIEQSCCGVRGDRCCGGWGSWLFDSELSSTSLSYPTALLILIVSFVVIGF
jgi:hypothetical protein